MKLSLEDNILVINWDNTKIVLLALEEANQLRHFLNHWENKEKLRPNKNWEECSYEGHHDSCDCNGMGGDR